MILFLLRSYCTDRLTDQRSAMHMELNNLNSVDIVRHLSVNRDYRLNRSTRIPAPFEQTPISQTNCPRAFIVLYNIVRAVDFFPPLLFIFIFIYFFFISHLSSPTPSLRLCVSYIFSGQKHRR